MKLFFISLLSFIVLDFLWLGFVVKDFNMRQLAEIGRFENGSFQMMYLPAILTYILLALAITFFVWPQIEMRDSLMQVFLWGALMGLIVYGVFDLTNLAILKNYPIAFVLADITWGAFVFGAVSLIAKKLA